MPDDGYFNDHIAATYDESLSAMFADDEVMPAVRLLASLAGTGRALELGIGTGRIALPLSRAGISVAGIDLSQAMVSKMRSKAGGTEIDVGIGDFASTTVAGSFRVVYLVFNTIMNLTTQSEQVACFRNAAAHLEEGGSFVVEVMFPDLQRLPLGETIRPFTVSETRLSFDEYDVPRQGLTSHHLKIVDGKFERFSIPFRYVWPSELDLMAQLAGLTLANRWSGWNQESFTNMSERHISVWTKHESHVSGSPCRLERTD